MAGKNSKHNPRLVSRRGWVKLNKRDVELIREQCPNFRSALPVWVACLILANDRRTQEASDRFTEKINLIAHLARLGYRVTIKQLHALEDCGLLEIQRAVPEGKRSPEGISTYVITPSEGRHSNDTGVGKKKHTPVCTKEHTPSAPESRIQVPTSLKKGFSKEESLLEKNEGAQAKRSGSPEATTAKPVPSPVKKW